ncbi:MAG: hypothetical protein HYY18_02325 [Planctomycetes bacterium]|nr:hypothetical protein [Planctomycetota bacterium]
MKCMVCGFDNEAREAYCRACGSPVKVSLDQVESDLISKADRQMEQTAEEEIRRWLVVAICLFLVAVTAKVLYGPSTWPVHYTVPSSGDGAPYAMVEESLTLTLEPMEVPIPKD